MDFKDHLKKAAAEGIVNEGLRWGRYLAIAAIVSIGLGTVTYFYGNAVKNAVVSTITWPWSTAKEKAGEIGKKTKEISDDAAAKARQELEHRKDQIKDGVGAAKDGIKDGIDTISDKLDTAKEKATDVKDRAKEEATEIGKSLKDRWQRIRGKTQNEPSTQE